MHANRMVSWLGAIACLALLASGCGGEGEGREGPYILAFELDHADVYGAIEVELEDGQSFVLEDGDIPTCADSQILVDSAEVQFEGLSERFFYWKDVPGTLDSGCLTIPLTVETLESGLLVFTYSDNRAPDMACYPTRYELEMEGRTVVLNDITKPGNVDHTTLVPEWGWKGDLEYIFNLVRDGRAAVAGGWIPEMEYRFNRIEVTGCGSGSGQGYSPLRYMLLARNTRAGR